MSHNQGNYAKEHAILTEHIRRPYMNVKYEEEWRNLPEIPTKKELLAGRGRANQGDESEQWNSYQDEPLYNPDLPHNIVDGPWPSTLGYIGAHYQILREDGIADLRVSIQQFRDNPRMTDSGETYVYTHVHIKGFQFAAIGAAFRVEFSPERAEKQIRWTQSKRLTQGSILAISPTSNGFSSICKVVVVAARPVIGGLDQNPPAVDLFWGDPDDLALDPSESYVMLEARGGYFEAYRHMLVAMQKLPHESFSLADELVSLNNEVRPPKYLLENPNLNLNPLVKPDIDPETGAELKVFYDPTLNNVDVLQNFPSIPNSGMDDSQMNACKRMLTSRVAIVQGPPGTGKTFTSVSAIKTLVKNLVASEEPPVIVAAQTNHALDQILKHVMKFEKDVARLGGRTAKENTEIKLQTLYELRMANPKFPGSGGGLSSCTSCRNSKIDQIKQALAPLLTPDLLPHETLQKRGIITPAHAESLFAEGWENGGDIGDGTSSGIAAWLGSSQTRPISCTPCVNLGLPMEELDLEFEQQLDQELEGPGIADDGDVDALQGIWVPYRRMLTGKASVSWDDGRIQKLLDKNSDLYNIPAGLRGTVYRYFERRLDVKILMEVGELLKEYRNIVDDTRIAKWHSNVKLMGYLGTKIIGCTTTGLAKYRGLIAAMQPRTLLIEEAAETLEGTIIAGMFDSLDQLILVGDHQQLQAHANIQALEKEPYNMAISMFERLVSNSMGYTMLNRQRRMIPEIRQLLCIEPKPFYEDLHDHHSVLDREINRQPIPGMDTDLYFFHHIWPESRNQDSSRYNLDEAQMIAGFFNYLVLNGTEPKNITVLTLYNGQRKTILRELKNHDFLKGHTYFNVFTVDSYQGEENDVILLSLVRSNEYQNIGFLDSKNRLVVALSRARRGLYIFGNAVNLVSGESTGEAIGRDPLWSPVVHYMRDRNQLDIDAGLPIVCQNHNTRLFVRDANEFSQLVGGCTEKCTQFLPCGHKCIYKCHAFAHDQIICQEPCKGTLACGHGCSKFCGDVCECAVCLIPTPPHPTMADKITENVAFSARKAASAMPTEPKSVRGWTEGSNTSTKKPSNAQKSHPFGSNLNSGKNGPGGLFAPSTNKPIDAQKNNHFLSSFNNGKNGQGGRSDISNKKPFDAQDNPFLPNFNGGKVQKDSQTEGRNLSSLTPPNAHSSAWGPEAVDKWKNFDAKKSDMELAKKRELAEAALANESISQPLIRETFRPTTVENGVRTKGKGTQRVLPAIPVGSANMVAASSTQQATSKETMPKGKPVSQVPEPKETKRKGKSASTGHEAIPKETLQKGKTVSSIPEVKETPQKGKSASTFQAAIPKETLQKGKTVSSIPGTASEEVLAKANSVPPNVQRVVAETSGPVSESQSKLRKRNKGRGKGGFASSTWNTASAGNASRNTTAELADMNKGKGKGNAASSSVSKAVPQDPPTGQVRTSYAATQTEAVNPEVSQNPTSQRSSKFEKGVGNLIGDLSDLGDFGALSSFRTIPSRMGNPARHSSSPVQGNSPTPADSSNKKDNKPVVKLLRSFDTHPSSETPEDDGAGGLEDPFSDIDDDSVLRAAAPISPVQLGTAMKPAGSPSNEGSYHGLEELNEF